MKLQLDTVGKTITLESNVQLSELVKHLDKLLPKDSPFGHWKEFYLQTNTVINNWANPIYVQPTLYPYWWQQPAPFTATCGATTTNADIFTMYSSGATVSGTNAVFNIELAN